MDAIDRQAAIKAVGYYSLHSGDKLLFADKPLKELPSVQPEIIRCKDCKYYTLVTARCEVRGKGLHLIRNMEDFCSRAERREDG